MTPERKAYLARCSDKARRLHKLIKSAKFDLSKCKEDLKLVPGLTFLKWRVKHAKVILASYRHELQRIKGMDRVFSRGKAPVKQSEFHSGIEYSAFYCGDCGYIVEVVEDDGEFKKSTIKFCPYCGRRILWGKGK